MRKEALGKAGLAATILLCPGGFLLGFALLANEYRKRAATTHSKALPEADIGVTANGEMDRV